MRDSFVYMFIEVCGQNTNLQLPFDQTMTVDILQRLPVEVSHFNSGKIYYLTSEMTSGIDFV